MKIKSIKSIKAEIIVTDDPEYPVYIRLEDGSWKVDMMGSWEEVCLENELTDFEKLYREHPSAMVNTSHVQRQ